MLPAEAAKTSWSLLMIGMSEEPNEEATAFTSSAIDDYFSVLPKFLGIQASEVSSSLYGEDSMREELAYMLLPNRVGPGQGPTPTVCCTFI